MTDKRKVLVSRFSRLVYCLFKTGSAHSRTNTNLLSCQFEKRVIVMSREAGDGFSFSEKPTVWFLSSLGTKDVSKMSELRMYNFEEINQQCQGSVDFQSLMDEHICTCP